MNLTKIERLLAIQTQLIYNQRESKSDTYEIGYTINEVSKAIKAELLLPGNEEVLPF